MINHFEDLKNYIIEFEEKTTQEQNQRPMSILSYLYVEQDNNITIFLPSECLQSIV